jgi:flavin-dependent dehydrogenase
VEVDVAIVGAGPAGSTLAAILAKRGRSVLLLERDTFPRDKLCGEFLSYDALPIIEAFGVGFAEAPRIRSCRVVGRHRTLEFELPHAALGVSRRLLDATLFDYAVRCGAKAQTGTTVGQLRELKAKTIAGAWGRWGRFDTQLERGFVRDHAHRNFGFKRHYSVTTPDAIELYSFSRGYLGVSPVENGVTNICGLVHESRLHGHKGRWDAFVEKIRAEEPVLDHMYARYAPADDQFLSSEPVIFRARSAVEGGIVMIGDASGVIDPLTGNGMAMAMQSALLAAQHILNGNIEGYRQAHHDFFAPRIQWSRAVASLLSRPAVLDQALRGPKALAELLLRKTRGNRDDVQRITSQLIS